MTMPPNHALQRTRPSRSSCNRSVPWARVAELGSLDLVTIRLQQQRRMFLTYGV